MVEREVCFADELALLHRILWEVGNAEAHGEMAPWGMWTVLTLRRLNVCAHTLGDLGGYLLRSLRQNDGKFIAAISGDEIITTACTSQQPTELLLRLIPGVMAVVVVLGLDLVEVVHDER